MVFSHKCGLNTRYVLSTVYRIHTLYTKICGRTSIFRNRGVKSPGILNKEYKEIHEQLKNAFKVSKYEAKALKNRKVFDAFIFYSLPSAMAQSELL